MRPLRVTRAATLKKASRSRLPRQVRNSVGSARVRSQRAGVVGEGGGVPPQPVAEEVLERGVGHAEVALQLADRLLGWATPQAVVVLDLGSGAEERRDVGDDGVEAPAICVVEGELFAATTG
jgi:hypothetical protein